MKFRNQGFGLLEVLLAVGVLGGLSLVVAQFSNNASKVTNNVEINNDVLSTVQQIQAVLTDPESCTATLVGKRASNASNVIQALRLKNNSVFVDAFQTKTANPSITYGQKFLKINSYSLSDAAEDVDVTNLGTTHLLVSFDRGTKGNQTETIAKKINLRVVVNASGDIVSCMAYSSGVSELWKYTANNADIFYSGGNVAIGTTTPTANFTVRSVTLPGTPGISIVGNESTTAGWNRSSIGFIDQSSTHQWFINMFGTASNEGEGSFGINGGPKISPPINRFIMTKDGDVGLGTRTPYCGFSSCPNGIDFQIHNPASGFADGAGLILSSDALAANSIVGAVAFGSSASPSSDKRPAVITGHLGSSSPTTSGSLVFWTAHNGANFYRMVLDSLGNLTVAGEITPASAFFTSDRNYKKNIMNLPCSLEKLQKIEGYTYQWRNSEKTKTELGLIAQNVEKVFPEVVAINRSGHKSINYLSLLAPVTETIKELYLRLTTRQHEISQIGLDSNLMKSYLCQKDPQADLCSGGDK